MLTEKQAYTLAKLSAQPLAELSDKQRAKLERLQQMQPAEPPAKRKAPPNEHAARTQRKEAKHTPSAPKGNELTKLPAPKQAPPAPESTEATKTPAARPCTDEGRWGADGQWEYPADKQIECSLCKQPFTFSGKEQAWYAQKQLYAPARCTECIAAKKEAKTAKLQSGRSGEGRCFNCGRSGHMSANCPEAAAAVPGGAGATTAGGRKACYVCGSEAHLSRNCPNAQQQAAAKGCFTCGSVGHLSRECPQRPPPACFNCGIVGHASKACPQPPRADGEPCFAFAKGQCHRKNCQFAHVG